MATPTRKGARTGRRRSAMRSSTATHRRVRGHRATTTKRLRVRSAGPSMLSDGNGWTPTRRSVAVPPRRASG